MRSLVLGSGSAGLRHASLLQALGHTVTLASRRNDTGVTSAAVSSSLREGAYSYVVVATETAAHHETVSAVLMSGYAGPMLIEKPCMVDWTRLERPLGPVAVGYNLRHHRAVATLRKWLGRERIYAAYFRVGQHLSSWRPSRPMGQQYSAWASRGGGVLADLSHEIDLALWLLGQPLTIGAVGGRVSTLPGDADDAWAIVMSTPRAPVVSITLDYLDDWGTREIVVHCAKGSIAVDLVRGTIRTKQGVDYLGDGPTLMQESYMEMHTRFLGGDGQSLCTLDDASGVEMVMTAIRRDAEGRL